MKLRLLNPIRRLSTTTRRLQPYLSENYKSKELWNDRFKCRVLSTDDETIRKINHKIIQEEHLSNLELDIFVNNTMPNTKDIGQLQESARLLKQFRRTLYAHVLMPSTPQALCRLFLYSDRLESLARLLDKRVDYGIFPDFFSYNLIIEKAIDQENYALAAKFASLVMLQEEFGVNPITDRLCLYGLVKYIEAQTNFNDWVVSELSTDTVFADDTNSQPQEMSNEVEETKEEEKNNDDDEEEEDAEYIRVPFLRNPYFDNHFDINSPRIICGKSLSMLSSSMQCETNLKNLSNLLGLVLQGKWEEAATYLKSVGKSNSELGPIKNMLVYYLNNSHDLEISEEQKSNLLDLVERVPSTETTFSELVKVNLLDGKLNEYETRDIEELKSDFTKYAEKRATTEKRNENMIRKKQIIESIQAKKEELKFKEQYLYFYDNLKKSRLTRITYD